MARQQVDSEDELKRKQRRRLIGAVALFTALVVIVPMVLDKQPKTGGQDIDLRIPEKDKAGEFTSQMVLPESAPMAESAPVAASAPAVIAPVPAIPATIKPGKVEPAHKPAKPEHKAAPAPTKVIKPKAGFAVQVGAFANPGAAQELRDKLRKQGLTAYTEKAGETVRVRVGVYATREAAEKVLHQLEEQGMHPAVVAAP